MIDTDKFCNFGINSLWFKKKNMNIQAEKIALAKMLLETENPQIIPKKEIKILKMNDKIGLSSLHLLNNIF